VEGSHDLIVPATDLTPAVWSGWLQASECLWSRLAEMSSGMNGIELDKGQLSEICPGASSVRARCC